MNLVRCETCGSGVLTEPSDPVVSCNNCDPRIQQMLAEAAASDRGEAFDR